MRASPTLEAVHSEVGTMATLDQVRARPLAMLDGGEIIELSIKPSLWYLPISAGRFTVLCALLAIATGLVAPPAASAAGTLTIAGFLAAAVVRVGVAALQWASRLYVLTNRRVLRFRGILTVHVNECPLSRVAEAELHSSIPQRLLRLGSIRVQPLDKRLEAVSWEHIARPAQVHETLLRAIRRARSGE